jgi:hypothetical protein
MTGKSFVMFSRLVTAWVPYTVDTMNDDTKIPFARNLTRVGLGNPIQYS